MDKYLVTYKNCSSYSISLSLIITENFFNWFFSYPIFIYIYCFGLFCAVEIESDWNQENFNKMATPYDKVYTSTTSSSSSFSTSNGTISETDHLSPHIEPTTQPEVSASAETVPANRSSQIFGTNSVSAVGINPEAAPPLSSQNDIDDK